MGKHVVRLGDPTSHGGTVVSAAENYSIMGKPVARMGDQCTCPLPGHSNCVIVEGDPTWTIDGRHVALEGHKLSCGGVVLSTLGNLERSYEGSGSSSLGGYASPAMRNSAASASNEEEFDQHFLVVDMKTGKPLVDAPYRIDLESGQSIEGRTDEDGKTEKVSSSEAEAATLHVLEEIPPLNPNWDR